MKVLLLILPGLLALPVSVLVYEVVRKIHYHLWERRWRKLPGHNPYKPGDSE